MVHGSSQVCCGLDKYKDKQLLISEFMAAFFWYQMLTLVYFSFDSPVTYKSLIIQTGVTPRIFFFGHRLICAFAYISLCVKIDSVKAFVTVSCCYIFIGPDKSRDFLQSSCSPKWQLSSWQPGFAEGCQPWDWKASWPNSGESYSVLFDVNYYETAIWLSSMNWLNRRNTAMGEY